MFKYTQYIDKYFLTAKKVLTVSGKDPVITLQIFQKTNALLCGMKYVNKFLSDIGKMIEFEHLPDGTLIKPFETVAMIKGHATDLIDLETIYLGILARSTRIATNVAALTDLTDKEIYFFPARFDYYLNQTIDGYAASIGGVSSYSTDAQAIGANLLVGKGTMPHALIACYNGDVAVATLELAKMYRAEGITTDPIIALVDYNNDCVKDAVRTANLLHANGIMLDGVRIDTSESMIDFSLIDEMGPTKKTGVCKELVFKVRTALDIAGHSNVKIYVSGGFNAAKIQDFERHKVPVDGYGVGSSCFDGKIDFTADIVIVNNAYEAKKGRKYLPINYRRA